MKMTTVAQEIEEEEGIARGWFVGLGDISKEGMAETAGLRVAVRGGPIERM